METEKELTLELEALKRKVLILEGKLHDKRPKKTRDSTDIDAILDEIFDRESEYASKTDEFWQEVDNKLRDGDIDFIKDLVRNKKLNMDETDKNGRTLLMLSAFRGCYELVAMCINLGANIDQLDNNNKTALKLSQQYGFPDIEELLMMNLLKTELGQRIEDTTNDIARKQGITHNFYRILNDLSHDDDRKTEDKSRRID
eukprot:1068438_1